MIRLVVVADTGEAMTAITATLARVPGIDIAAYASGTAPLRAVVEATAPDVVVLDEMRRPGLALTRIEELAAACPGVPAIGLSGEDPRWVVAALRAGAAAVVPRNLPATTLGRVLRDVAGRRLERHAA